MSFVVTKQEGNSSPLGSPTYSDSDDEKDYESNGINQKFPRLPSTRKLLAGGPLISKPHYLRECLDGMLLSSVDDNTTVISCILSAGSLIRSHPFASKELAIEFASALIHSEMPPSPDDTKVVAAKHDALVAIGTVAPAKVAPYLTGLLVDDVNCRNNLSSQLSFAQKSNILSAITDISCCLAADSPNKTLMTRATQEKLNNITNNEEDNLKTKRLIYHRNDFTRYAGIFFFPLASLVPTLADRLASGTAFFHQDDALLARLVATMATIYACCGYDSILPSMAKCMIEVVSGLRSHPEPAVRRSCLTSLGTVLTTTPSIYLDDLLISFTQLPQPLIRPHLVQVLPDVDISQLSVCGSMHSQLSPMTSSSLSQISKEMNLFQWLESSVRYEDDSECKILSSACLSILVGKFSNL
ncbi:unnamed protein product [Protopolystoma xenopodis]|uniref:Telomere length regulation protein conserved domain-containing protein n=1 Tax=Protopolystoma xenopodis TaxID=117903 RepID=A0A3S5BDY3_9PLAT|nr:unnamed protein product [Protopolystoma xenopodis]